MTEIKNSILAGIAFGVLVGIYFAIRYNLTYALIAGAISGIVFGIILYFFVTSKTVKQQTQIENLEDEKVVYSGGANHFLKGEAVGGKLYLLADRFQFQSHKFNIQNHGLIIKLEEIEKVGFYNTLGLVPNGLAITKKNGNTEKFVVNNRKSWKSEIEKISC